MQPANEPKEQGARPLLSGFWVTSLGTLASRVLGLVRDVATAAAFGQGEVMDAFVVAFRLPNLMRKLFGEGALAASYMPVLAAEHVRQPAAAWRLCSAVLAWLTALLAALVAIGELGCLIAWSLGGNIADFRLLVSLTAVMLPYVVFICVAAQISATLQSFDRFALPAISPAVLNLAWIAGVLWIAPTFSKNREIQAHVLAVCVLSSGVLQIAVQWPGLRRLGFRFHYDWTATRGAARQVAAGMAPMILGLAVTQLNSLSDSLLAWLLARPSGGPERVWWLADMARYPLTAGAAAAIYYGERFYQFPLGILGVAVATVIFPLLSRHAARGDRESIGRDLSLALRFVTFATLPASVGLMLLAEPLAQVIFQRGEFSRQDTLRTAWMIAGYSSAAWAYCALPVVVRGYYALLDQTTPMRIAMAAMTLDLLLNVTLIFPLQEFGLAVSTAAVSILQLVTLEFVFSRKHSRLDWPGITRGFVGCALACAAMAGVVAAIRWYYPAGEGLMGQLGPLVASVVFGAATYYVVAAALRLPELKQLPTAGRRPPISEGF